MRSRFKTTVVIAVVVALAVAVTGVASAPAAKQAPAVAKQAKKKHKKVKAGPIPPDFFGVVPLFAPSASDAQAMSAAGVQTVRRDRLDRTASRPRSAAGTLACPHPAHRPLRTRYG